MAGPTDRAVDEPARLDRDEIAMLLAQYGPALRRYFSRKANPTDAEDLVQEVFLRLQTHAHRTPSEKIERYIFTIAKHVFIDRHRMDLARGVQSRAPLEDADGATDLLSPERIVMARDEFRRVIEAIGELPPRMRTAFLLHRFDKLGYGAIAKRMNMSKSGVRGLMERAFQRLGQKLEGDL